MIRQLALALVDALPMFSLKMVKMVAGYIAFGFPTAGVDPRPLDLFITQKLDGNYTNLAMNPLTGEIWVTAVCGLSCYLAVLDMEKSLVFRLELMPSGIAIAPSGQAFVCVPGGVAVFDPYRNMRFLIGSKETGEAKFESPRAVALREALVFVVERNRIGVFKMSGEFVRSWKVPDAKFINGLLASSEGLFFSELLHNIIQVTSFCPLQHLLSQVYDENGTFLRKFDVGDQGMRPTGMAFDLAGNLLVCDRRKPVVQVFTSAGALITQFHVDQPGSVHVDQHGVIWVGCSGRLHAFGYARDDSWMDEMDFMGQLYELQRVRRMELQTAMQQRESALTASNKRVDVLSSLYNAAHGKQLQANRELDDLRRKHEQTEGALREQQKQAQVASAAVDQLRSDTKQLQAKLAEQESQHAIALHRAQQAALEKESALISLRAQYDAELKRAKFQHFTPGLPAVTRSLTACADDDMDALQEQLAQALCALTAERSRRVRRAAEAAAAAEAKQQLQCAICFDRPPNCSLQCGHVLCFECAGKVQQCPTCRAHILTRTKLFM